MCLSETPTRERYTRDILALQERLNFRTLSTIQEFSYRAVRADGLLTLALRTDQLTNRHLLGMQGFRLAQYLHLGWVCPDAIAARGMFCEPTQGLNDDDLHFVTVSGDGRILGYLGLVTSKGGASLRMEDPDRTPFPVEIAHHINLADVVLSVRRLTTDRVRELKRFVHRQSMTDQVLRLRVTIELLLAAGTVVLEMPVRTLVGDVEEHVALRHLMMMGLRIQLVEGTRPALADQHYLHHAYIKRAAVVPFVAEIPSSGQLARRLQRLQNLLDSADPRNSIGTLIADRGSSQVERISA
jgi:hypothetical protein